MKVHHMKNLSLKDLYYFTKYSFYKQEQMLEDGIFVLSCANVTEWNIGICFYSFHVIINITRHNVTGSGKTVMILLNKKKKYCFQL